MRVLIVDDEAPARARVRRMLAELPEVEVVGEAADGLEAIDRVTELEPDLVLLDVQMPELDGFGVVHALDPALSPAIVFLTAHDEYALRAFEVEALDYLLKPVASARLARAVERARLRAASPAELKAHLPPRRHLERLIVQERGRAVVVRLADVERIEAEQNYVRLHTLEGELLHRSTITALAAALDPRMFTRVSRSVIVRIDAIRELRSATHGDRDILLRSGAVVRWSRLYRARGLGPGSE